MRTLIARLGAAEEGATAIEYGLIAALISVVIITALGMLNVSMTDMYDYINRHIQTAINR